MTAVTERGAPHPVSLRFLDEDLEREYQLAAGQEGIGGYRVIAGASFVVWVVAALLVPIGTDLPSSVVIPIAAFMALVSLVALGLSRWAVTLDRQHALATMLTTANGVVILVLAVVGDALPGYGVGAIMLLFAWGFVSRTRFVYAALRSALIAIAFMVATATYRGSESLVLDAFFFVASAAGSLVGLYIIERGRRRLYSQDILIREQGDAIERERAKSDRLLLNVMPASISARLRESNAEIADEYPSVSVLFADIVGFTPLAARLSPTEVVRMLGELFSAFDRLVEDRGLEKIKTIGDCYMAVGGLPEPLDGHAERVVDLGLAMLDEASHHGLGGEAAPLRIGVNSGRAVGGVIGRRTFAFDVWGDTVNVASRLQQQGVPHRVHISEATWELVRDRFECESQGSVELRGRGSMETYVILGRRDGQHVLGRPSHAGPTEAA